MISTNPLPKSSGDYRPFELTSNQLTLCAFSFVLNVEYGRQEQQLLPSTLVYLHAKTARKNRS